MAGKEIYIGRMIESLQSSMDEQVEAMREVAAQIVTVAQNTGQTVASLNIKAGEDFEDTFFAASQSVSSGMADGSSTTTQTSTGYSDLIKSQAAGNAVITLTGLTVDITGNVSGCGFAVLIVVDDEEVATSGRITTTSQKGAYTPPELSATIQVQNGSEIKIGLRVYAGNTKTYISGIATMPAGSIKLQYALKTLTQDGAFY